MTPIYLDYNATTPVDPATGAYDLGAGAGQESPLRVDIDAVDSEADIPYEIPNLRVEYRCDEPPAVPTGRSPMPFCR